MELEHLLSPSEAATYKGMSLSLFMHYEKEKRVPEVVIIGKGHRFYDKEKIRQWEPIMLKRGRPREKS